MIAPSGIWKLNLLLFQEVMVDTLAREYERPNEEVSVGLKEASAAVKESSYTEEKLLKVYRTQNRWEQIDLWTMLIGSLVVYLVAFSHFVILKFSQELHLAFTPRYLALQDIFC
jgi:hypothetical protein